MSADDKKERLKAALQRNPLVAMDLAAFFFGGARSDIRDTCAVCFSPPGVECNRSVGWLGGVDAGEHARAALVDCCPRCNGTGKLHDAAALQGFRQCDGCHGTRRAAG